MSKKMPCIAGEASVRYRAREARQTIDDASGATLAAGPGSRRAAANTPTAHGSIDQSERRPARRAACRARARALRGAVRFAHALDEELRDARDDGADRTRRRHLARRRTARHVHV